MNKLFRILTWATTIIISQLQFLGKLWATTSSTRGLLSEAVFLKYIQSMKQDLNSIQKDIQNMEQKPNIPQENDDDNLKMSTTDLTIPAYQKEFVQKTLAKNLYITPRSNLATMAFDDHVVFAGGTTPDGKACSTIDIFKINENKVIDENRLQKIKLDESKTEMAMVQFQDFAILAGGRNGTTYYDTIDIFQFKDGILQNINTGNNRIKLRQAQANIAGVVCGQYILFAGGNNGKKGKNNIEVLVWNQNSFHLIPTKNLKLSVSRDGCGAVVQQNDDKDYILFAGGSSGLHANYHDSIDIFELDHTAKTIKKAELLESPTLSIARKNMTIAKRGGLILFAGGETDLNSYSNVIDIFKYENGKFLRTTTNLSSARIGMNVFYRDNAVVFAGGEIAETTGKSKNARITRKESNIMDVIGLNQRGRSRCAQENMLISRSFFGSAQIGDRLLIAGGQGEDAGTIEMVGYEYPSSCTYDLQVKGLTLKHRIRAQVILSSDEELRLKELQSLGTVVQIIPDKNRVIVQCQGGVPEVDLNLKLYSWAPNDS